MALQKRNAITFGISLHNRGSTSAEQGTAVFLFSAKVALPRAWWRAIVGSGLSGCISITGLLLLMQFHLVVLVFVCLCAFVPVPPPPPDSLPLSSSALSQMGLNGAQNAPKV